MCTKPFTIDVLVSIIDCLISEEDLNIYAGRLEGPLIIQALEVNGWEIQSYEDFYELAVSAFKIDDSNSSCNEQITVSLSSPYSFLSINTATKQLTLIPQESDDIGTYDAAFI